MRSERPRIAAVHAPGLALLLAASSLGACAGDKGDRPATDGGSVVDDTGCAPVSGHPDADGDGYGDRELETACEPGNWVDAGSDCDDADPAVHPGADEVCNGLDDDCDGRIDTADSSLTDGVYRYADEDGDGHGGERYVFCDTDDGVDDGTDCDDADPDAFPGAYELCNDGVDQDCDGDDRACDLSGATLVTEADVSIVESGDTIDVGIGREVRYVGDVLGTGTDALAIGARRDSQYAEKAGAIYLYARDDSEYAPTTPEGARATVRATSKNTAVGEWHTVWGVGDFDGDGSDDLLVNWLNDAWGGYRDRGSVYLFSGPMSGEYLPGDSLAWVPGPEEEDLAFGFGSTGGQDVTGDGAPDLVLACFPWPDPDVESVGAAWVVPGPVSGTIDIESIDTRLVGQTPWADFAISTSLGDLDADGQADVIVDETGGDRVHVFFGPITGERGAADADVTLTEIERSRYPSAPEVADLDGDGADDLLIGAPDEEPGGGAYVLHGPFTRGSRRVDERAWAHTTCFEPCSVLGREAAAGDVDGDGFPDILLGDVVLGEEAQGGAFLLYGPVTGTVDPLAEGVAWVGAEDADYAGRSLDLGDFDGDGHADPAIGAPQTDGIAGTAGAVYVFLGGPR